MKDTPLHDFDEAHRAENAKKMKEYRTFFVPLTGSQFDRVDYLKIPLRENPSFNLFYHLERPFLVYLLMILSTSFFGTAELFYRLPSFVLGMASIFVFILFTLKYTKKDTMPLFLSLLALITSSDLWLSSQYAQLDTGITFFLFLSFTLLLFYAERKSKKVLFLSGLSFSLAVLSKGQPSVVLAIPLLALLIFKKINIKDIFIFIAYSSILLIPWVLYLSFTFGLATFLGVFIGFAVSSSERYIHHVAPFLWYLRWLSETLRPGLLLFLSLFIFDLVNRNFDWKKYAAVVYILGGLFIFSVQTNKIWWYVLPFVPVIALYIFLSSSDYLSKFPKRVVNLLAVVFVGSLPFFINVSNKQALIYQLMLLLFSILILRFKFLELLFSYRYYLSFLVILASLLFFYSRFPFIIPYYPDTKEVALYYSKITSKKCLWVYDMPSEAALFYSNAGEVPPLNPTTAQSDQFKFTCEKNFLITSSDIDDEYLKFIEKKSLVFQKGRIKLIEVGNAKL